MIANQENKAAHREKGFTLVEMLIALTIFAIGILGVASTQVWGLRGNSSAIWHTQAATFAADRIEQLMAVPYANLASLSPGNETQGDNDEYKVSWTVFPNDPIDFTSTITVNVQWDDHGTTKTFTPAFTCYRAEIVF